MASVGPREAGESSFVYYEPMSDREPSERDDRSVERIARSVRDAPSWPVGVATGIGSLPHLDPAAAAQLVLEVTAALPAAPQLPRRSPLEQMVVQWVRALPEVRVEPDGTFSLRPQAGQGPLSTTFDADAHAGLLAFVDAAASVAPRRVKLQCTGPLTLTLALQAAGLPVDRALTRATDCARSWAGALAALATARLPSAIPLVVFDEPGLVAWSRRRAPVDRDTAIDTLASVIVATPAATGVHVCGDGDVALAAAAGPQVLFCELRPDLVQHAGALARHLDGSGHVGWGVVPTDRPLGESAEPLWRSLRATWDELAAHGCDAARLATQALVSPSCGLAGHGLPQAVHALRLSAAVGAKVAAYAEQGG